jgi:hypothetical protein
MYFYVCLCVYMMVECLYVHVHVYVCLYKVVLKHVHAVEDISNSGLSQIPGHFISGPSRTPGYCNSRAISFPGHLELRAIAIPGPFHFRAISYSGLLRFPGHFRSGPSLTAKAHNKHIACAYSAFAQVRACIQALEAPRNF